MTTITCGELFAGYGGLHMATHTALAVLGFSAELRWVAEVDPAPSRILAVRFPEARNIGDVTAVDWSDPALRVDLVAGGSPCQDISDAGKRRGMTEGTRSNLWVQQMNAIKAIEPRFVVWENVKGALSSGAESNSSVEFDQGPLGDGRAGYALRPLGRVLGDLSEAGFDAQWATFPASGIGAPHRRERVFVLAHRRGQ